MTFWKLVLVRSLLHATLLEIILKKLPSSFSIFAVGITLQTLAEGGASCSFLWAFARFSQVLAVTPHRLLRVAGAAGRICCLLSLPHLKWHGLQLNLLLIGMHGRLPNCLESVRWELKTSGILILTQAFPALQHSIVRGQGGCPCMDRNQVTVPSRWEAGSSSFWHAQELLILVRICTASKVQSPLRNWIQSLKTNDFILLLWFSNYFSSPTLFAVRMEP